MLRAGHALCRPERRPAEEAKPFLTAAAACKIPEMVTKKDGCKAGRQYNPKLKLTPVNERAEEQQYQFSWNRQSQVLQQQAEEDRQVSVVLQKSERIHKKVKP